MARNQQQMDQRLKYVEEAVTEALAVEVDPVDQILASVDRIMGQAHDVALRQCKKAREAIEAASREALNTIDLIEGTINRKRDGTSEQIRNYMGAVRTATISADEVHASTITGIGAIREAIGRVSEQVLALPTSSAPPVAEERTAAADEKENVA